MNLFFLLLIVVKICLLYTSLLGAFIGAMLILVLILFFSTLLKSNIMLLITGIMIEMCIRDRCTSANISFSTARATPSSAFDVVT